MDKIAIELERTLTERRESGGAGRLATRRLASGPGWTVDDVLCTSDVSDRAYEERHDSVRIAVVAAGSFEYRTSTAARQTLTPGSLLLGNDGERFECGHAHAAGDRCVSFGYTPEYFERLASDAGLRGSDRCFRHARLPALRGTAGIVARVRAGLERRLQPDRDGALRWETLSVELAVRALRAQAARTSSLAPPRGAAARIVPLARAMERDPSAPATLASLASDAGLSVFHFVRTFEQVIGATPHQYLLRARLRRAASDLSLGDRRVLDVALDCGFDDLSNFNRRFRAEFGVTPRDYRRHAAGCCAVAG